MDDRHDALSPAAVDALVANHRRFLAFVERRVGSRSDAEEIVQAAFVRGVEHGDQLEDEGSVVAWFYRLLRNAIVDHWRRRGAAGRAEESLAAEWRDAHAPAPELAAELCRCFEPLLDQLGAERAEMLRRVDLGDERPADVARDLGITPNNAMVRLHRARRALRERLEASCRTCAEHGCLDCTCARSEGAHGCH